MQAAPAGELCLAAWRVFRSDFKTGLVFSALVAFYIGACNNVPKGPQYLFSRKVRFL